MMEVPILKTWLNNLVSDALATAWVDPGQLEINVNSTNEGFVPDHNTGNLFASGVLSFMIRIDKSIAGPSK